MGAQRKKVEALCGGELQMLAVILPYGCLLSPPDDTNTIAGASATNFDGELSPYTATSQWHVAAHADDVSAAHVTTNSNQYASCSKLCDDLL